jgi:uncharacterized protein YgbK (DUF1537 family)
MKILVVGDDLTGCNAAGALFAQAGFTTLSILGEIQDSHLAATAEVLVFNTNSRLDSEVAARSKVSKALQALATDPIISKRIDSTFRGNIGAELDGIKEFLNERFPGQVFKFLVVAAFPDAGRTTKNAIHFVHGIPISESNVNTDEKQSLESSNLIEILTPQTGLSIDVIPLEGVTSGVEALSSRMLSTNAEVIICDAESNEHIIQIAQAAAKIESTKAIHWVSVDPGPFSVALIEARGIHPEISKPVVLSFVASHTNETSEQLIDTQENIGAHWIKVNSNGFDLDEIIHEVTTAIESGKHFIGIDFSRSDFEGLTTKPISVLSRSIIDEVQPAAVYASGGETAAAVLLGLGANAFTIDFEILPLAVSGRILGGPFSGLTFATKGGLIGEKDATTKCLKHLMQLSTFRTSTNNNRKGTTP